MAGATIVFRFDSVTDEAQFVRAYLPEAWERFEASDYWETGWFWSYRQFAQYESGPDGGLVRLVFEGKPDRLVESESSRWDRFSGLSSWSLRRYEDEGYESLLEQQKDTKGATGGEWEYRLKQLVTRFSLEYYREFEEPLPMTGEEGAENPEAIGFWTAIHDVLTQCGYDWYDETAMCRKALKNRLKSIAAYRGADAAREEYDRVLAEWQAHRDELERWLDENPTGQATEP
jgi:hypothetical protein